MPCWDDFDEVLAEIEGRNPLTGRTVQVEPFKLPPNGRGVKKGAKHKPMSDEARAKRNARNKLYMQKRRANWVSRGLTTLGKERIDDIANRRGRPTTIETA